MALYGLSIFNLHYWGFGLPFIMVGAWYLVRAYRLSREAQVGQGRRGAASAVRSQPRRAASPRSATRPDRTRSVGRPSPSAGKELEAG